MDAISHKYTGKPFPFRSPEGRVALVIEIEKARYMKLPFEHTRPSSVCCFSAPLDVAGPSVQCRSKSLWWRGIGLFSGRPVPFLSAPLAPTSSLEPSLRLLPPRFPQPLQSSLWKFRLPR